MLFNVNWESVFAAFHLVLVCQSRFVSRGILSESYIIYVNLLKCRTGVCLMALNMQLYVLQFDREGRAWRMISLI